MKKSFLSVILLVALALNLNISSYASVGDVQSLKLERWESDQCIFNSEDMEMNDDVLTISVSIETSNPDYIIKVVDRTENNIVASLSSRETSLYHSFGSIINPNHDYEVHIFNVGFSLLRGKLMAVID
ncbi:hypothetical protein HZI73_12255 [Vallitalea pronyensis]|uniref:DUF3244 domain-containing protein n=1 Tax=Vallitalea pronyensis TaxID=1348613 RepID=A0A8J8MK78_9FIRM|nr:hypothetical protein [Vallitalea pronyensis]QUI23016.1 hypothetical protein HZI73_12255 [Vallitalea pronyensis]